LNRPEAPRPERPFDQPWQAQAFALTLALHARGAFTWPEWSDALGRAIAAAPDAPYYQSWLTALEGLARAKGLTVGAELTDRKNAWAHAYLHTPHGQPVELRAPQG
jgi:nitrile hydratase accessory protein